MELPHTLSSWFGLLGHLILLLAPPGVLIWRLLSAIAKHSICLSGQRIRDKRKPEIVYRFSIQNNEDVPVTGKRSLTIQVLDAGGRFLEGRDLEVYKGCNLIYPDMGKNRKSWKMTFDELPAYETWTIQCAMNRESQNLRLFIDDAASSQDAAQSSKEGEVSAKAAHASGPHLSHSELVLPADQSSVFVGRRTTPEAWWATLAVVVAFGAYALAFYLFVYQEYERIATVDWIAAASIVAFGFVLWLLTRRVAPSIAQGYWTTGHLSEQPKAEEDSLETVS